MSTISQYTFQKNFNVDYLTKNQATQYGVTNTEFAAGDTDGDRQLSIEEIMANEEISEALLAQINNAAKTVAPKEPEKAPQTGANISYEA